MLELVRAAVLLLGGFAFGISVTVLVLYVRAQSLGRARRTPPYFVPAIGLSHCLLILAVDGEIVQHVIQREAFEWWLSPCAAIAFGLSIWALVEMLRSIQLRQLHADVEAHRLR